MDYLKTEDVSKSKASLLSSQEQRELLDEVHFLKELMSQKDIHMTIATAVVQELLYKVENLMKKIKIAKTKSNANQGIITSNENENNRKVIRDIEEEIEQFESICKNFIDSVPKKQAPSITSSHNDDNLGIADSLESDLNLQLEKDFEYLGLDQPPYREHRRAHSIAGFDRRSSKDLMSDSQSITLGKALEDSIPDDYILPLEELDSAVNEAIRRNQNRTKMNRSRNSYRSQRRRQRKLEKDINGEPENELNVINDMEADEDAARDRKINFIINALLERGNEYLSNITGLENQIDDLNKNVHSSFSSSASSSVYSYSSSSDEEDIQNDKTKISINESIFSSTTSSTTPKLKPIRNTIKKNDMKPNKMLTSRLMSEPIGISSLLKSDDDDKSKDKDNKPNIKQSMSLPLPSILSESSKNNNIKLDSINESDKTKSDNQNSIDIKKEDKQDNSNNEKSESEKKSETATSLFEKILDKRPPLIPINDGKESNLKLKKQKNRRRNSSSEKRYGSKKKLRSQSNLETIKEDEELSNNKLPIRRVAKYSVDFKRDKPEQIIPHSTPRTRMPPSNKKQRIQNEIHSTLLNHTRQLQQRVFYLESKRLELQDLISEYELEKETLTKQLDKQTNTKVNYEKKIWELECKLYECNDNLNHTEENITKLRNELEQKSKENHKYQEQLENLRFDFEQMRYDKDMEIDAKLKNIQFYKKKWEDSNRKIEKLEDDNNTLRLEFENTLKNLRTENKLHPDDDLNMILGGVTKDDDSNSESDNDKSNINGGRSRNSSYYLPEIMEKSNSLNVYSLMQKNKLKNFSNQIDTLSTSLAEAHQENETLKERIDVLIQERDWLEKEKQDLSELLMQTQEMVEELEEEKQQSNQPVLDNTSDNDYYIPNSSIIINEDFDYSRNMNGNENEKSEIINVSQNPTIPLNLGKEIMDSIDYGHSADNTELQNPFNFGNTSLVSPVHFTNNSSFINVNNNNSMLQNNTSPSRNSSNQGPKSLFDELAALNSSISPIPNQHLSSNSTPVSNSILNGPSPINSDDKKEDEIKFEMESEFSDNENNNKYEKSEEDSLNRKNLADEINDLSNNNKLQDELNGIDENIPGKNLADELNSINEVSNINTGFSLADELSNINEVSNLNTGFSLADELSNINEVSNINSCFSLADELSRINEVPDINSGYSFVDGFNNTTDIIPEKSLVEDLNDGIKEDNDKILDELSNDNDDKFEENNVLNNTNECIINDEIINEKEKVSSDANTNIESNDEEVVNEIDTHEMILNDDNKVKKKNIIENNVNEINDTEAPLTKNEIPLTENEIPLTENEIPLTENEIPLTENEIPLTENETPLTENETPLTENETPLTENEIPLTENEIPLTENEIPLTENEIPLTENEIQVFNNNVNEISDNIIGDKLNDKINIEKVNLNEINKISLNKNKSEDNKNEGRINEVKSNDLENEINEIPFTESENEFNVIENEIHDVPTALNEPNTENETHEIVFPSNESETKTDINENETNENPQKLNELENKTHVINNENEDENEKEKENEKLDDIENEVNEVTSALSETESKIYNIENDINEVPLYESENKTDVENETNEVPLDKSENKTDVEDEINEVLLDESENKTDVENETNEVPLDESENKIDIEDETNEVPLDESENKTDVEDETNEVPLDESENKIDVEDETNKIPIDESENKANVETESKIYIIENDINEVPLDESENKTDVENETNEVPSDKSENKTDIEDETNEVLLDESENKTDVENETNEVPLNESENKIDVENETNEVPLDESENKTDIEDETNEVPLDESENKTDVEDETNEVPLDESENKIDIEDETNEVSVPLSESENKMDVIKNEINEIPLSESEDKIEVVENEYYEIPSQKLNEIENKTDVINNEDKIENENENNEIPLSKLENISDAVEDEVNKIPIQLIESKNKTNVNENEINEIPLAESVNKFDIIENKTHDIPALLCKPDTENEAHEVVVPSNESENKIDDVENKSNDIPSSLNMSSNKTVMIENEDNEDLLSKLENKTDIIKSENDSGNNEVPAVLNETENNEVPAILNETENNEVPAILNETENNKVSVILNETENSDVPAIFNETENNKVPAILNEIENNKVPVILNETENNEVPAILNETENNEVPAILNETENNEVPAILNETENNEVPAILNETENNEVPAILNETENNEVPAILNEIENKTNVIKTEISAPSIELDHKEDNIKNGIHEEGTKKIENNNKQMEFPQHKKLSKIRKIKSNNSIKTHPQSLKKDEFKSSETLVNDNNNIDDSNRIEIVGKEKENKLELKDKNRLRFSVSSFKSLIHDISVDENKHTKENDSKDYSVHHNSISVKENQSPSPIDNLMKIEKENELKEMMARLKEAIHINEIQMLKTKKTYVAKKLRKDNHLSKEEDSHDNQKMNLSRKKSYSSISSKKSTLSKTTISSIDTSLTTSGIMDPKTLKELEESRIVHNALIQCMNYIEKDLNQNTVYKSPFVFNKDKEDTSNPLYSYSNNPSLTSLSNQNDLPNQFILKQDDLDNFMNSSISLYSDENKSFDINNSYLKKHLNEAKNSQSSSKSNLENSKIPSTSDSINPNVSNEYNKKAQEFVASTSSGIVPTLSMPSLNSQNNIGLTSSSSTTDKILPDNEQRPPLLPSNPSHKVIYGAVNSNDKNKTKLENVTTKICSEPPQMESVVATINENNLYPKDFNSFNHENRSNSYDNYKHLSMNSFDNEKRISIYSLDENHLPGITVNNEDAGINHYDNSSYKLIKKVNSTDSLENMNIIETKPVEDLPLKMKEKLLMDNDIKSIAGTFGNRSSSIYYRQDNPMVERVQSFASLIKNKKSLPYFDVNNKITNESNDKPSTNNVVPLENGMRWDQLETEMLTESTDTNKLIQSDVESEIPTEITDSNMVASSEFETTTTSFITDNPTEISFKIPSSHPLRIENNIQFNLTDDDSIISSHSMSEGNDLNGKKQQNKHQELEKSDKIDYTSTLDNIDSSMLSWSEEIINQNLGNINNNEQDDLENDFANLNKRISTGQMKMEESFIIENKLDSTVEDNIINEETFYDTHDNAIEGKNDNKEKEKAKNKPLLNSHPNYNRKTSLPTTIRDYKSLYSKNNTKNNSNKLFAVNSSQINRYSGIPAADNFIPSVYANNNKPKTNVNENPLNSTILSKGKGNSNNFDYSTYLGNTSYFKLRDNASEILKSLSATADEDYLYSINILRKTMNGTWMYKFNRYGKNPHLRYFWIHPYNKLIYWSRREPSEKFKHQIKTKSEYIQDVFKNELKSKYKDTISCYPHIINVKTPQRVLQISALTKEDFDIWYKAIQSLIHKFEGYSNNNDLVCLNYNKSFVGPNTSKIDEDGNITASINQSTILNNSFLNSNNTPDIPIYESNEVKNSTRSKGNDSILSMSVKSLISSLPSKVNKNSENHHNTSYINATKNLPSTLYYKTRRKNSVLSNNDNSILSELNGKSGDKNIRNGHAGNGKDEFYTNNGLHNSFSSLSQINNDASTSNNTNGIFKSSKPLSLRSFSLNLNKSSNSDKKSTKEKGRRLSVYSNKNVSQYLSFHRSNSKKKGTNTSIHSVNLDRMEDNKSTPKVKHKRSFSFLSIDSRFNKNSSNNKNKTEVPVDNDEIDSSHLINESRQAVRQCACHNHNHHQHH